MDEVIRYFALAFSALIPLINPPASAFELLGIVGLDDVKPYKFLAQKIAINTFIFLAFIGLAGPYVLQFFGISIELLQLMGGSVLVAMGWNMLNKKDEQKEATNPDVRQAAEACKASYWQTQAFYPLTFPMTVGPGSVAVMLTLSGEARGLALTDRVGAVAGLVLTLIAMSLLIYIFYAYAPRAAKWVPPAAAQGILRIVAFLVVCIGGQIAWHGLRALLASVVK
jgi:multiple antibiotic resistance protein